MHLRLEVGPNDLYRIVNTITNRYSAWMPEDEAGLVFEEMLREHYNLELHEPHKLHLSTRDMRSLQSMYTKAKHWGNQCNASDFYFEAIKDLYEIAMEDRNPPLHDIAKRFISLSVDEIKGHESETASE